MPEIVAEFCAFETTREREARRKRAERARRPRTPRPKAVRRRKPIIPLPPGVMRVKPRRQRPSYGVDVVRGGRHVTLLFPYTDDGLARAAEIAASVRIQHTG